MKNKLTVQDLSQQAQQEIASLTEKESQKAAGSLGCLVEYNRLDTYSSAETISEYVVAVISANRAEAAADNLFLSDEEYEKMCAIRDKARKRADAATQKVIAEN